MGDAWSYRGPGRPWNSSDYGPDKPLPGKGVTRCNRMACQTELRTGSRAWNTSTQAWYCWSCALRINETSPGLCVPEEDAAAPKPAPQVKHWSKD